MKLIIQNIEYFEWEIPNEIAEQVKDGKTHQNIIDEFFQPDDISVDQINDTYYEINEILED